ncbi:MULTISPECIES: YmfL family putative regulatory protein [Pantoea]|uniref:YmfL family putative regulatory protein n=1 Tax=Pantoea TaxID=53335 RepID=UPI000CDDC896|nr:MULTISPECIES: YmfL family putative regulatory protein [Pantoea]POW57016.1 DNA-binding protein [Pantoea alvi]UBN52747.1 DNA-binding protein [Pantoea agglomerans]
MGKPDWQIEKQPAWLVAAIRKTITSMPGGYAEAAEWLGITENALFNRLRLEGDQIFPMGWAMVLQQASGTKYIADAVSRQSNSVNVPMVEIEDVDNADINERLMESVEWIGKHSAYLRKATEDGVIDAAEREQIEENSYQVMAKWQEHLTLLYRVFCPPDKANAPGCSPERSVATKSLGVEK